jgi:hypothetical protein
MRSFSNADATLTELEFAFSDVDHSDHYKILELRAKLDDLGDPHDHAELLTAEQLTRLKTRLSAIYRRYGTLMGDANLAVDKAETGRTEAEIIFANSPAARCDW